MLANLTNTQQFILTLVGMICVTAAESVALYKGMDGVMLTSFVGGIVGLVGLAYGVKIGRAKAKKELE